MRVTAAHAVSDRSIPSLDGLRAISVIMVIGGHLELSGSAPKSFSAISMFFNGEIGVRTFFVISGFLITSLLTREMIIGQASLANFYIRRFLRLVPVQLTFLAVLVLLTHITNLRVSSCQFVTALTYTKNYACGGWIDGHLWSLSVEEQFYLLWPFILTRLPRRWAVFIAVMLIVISPLSRATEYFLGNRGGFFPWLTSNTDSLMIGCLLALGIDRDARLIAIVSAFRPAAARFLTIAVIALPAVLELNLSLGWFTVMFGPTLQAAATAYLIMSVVYHRHGLSYALLNLRVVRYIGLLSYSLYIWQQILLSQPSVFGLDRPVWPIAFPANVVLCLVSAYLSYRLIENPINGLRNHFRLGIVRVAKSDID